MKTRAIEREKTGLLLALGFTKKEIANKTGKSIHTIGQQTRRLYEKTGSNNIADLTRSLIRRYSGIAVEDILLNAMRDITILVVVGLVAWAANSYGFFNQIEVTLSELANSLISIIK